MRMHACAEDSQGRGRADAPVKEGLTVSLAYSARALDSRQCQVLPEASVSLRAAASRPSVGRRLR